MAFLTVTDDGRDTWFPDSPRAYAGSVARCQEFSRTRMRDSAFYPSYLSCVISLRKALPLRFRSDHHRPQACAGGP